MIYTSEAERFSFTPFTRHAFFTHVNRWIVERVVAPGRKVIVDLGCGPGAVTKLILERLGSRQDARVIGVDPEPTALAKARAAVSARIAEFLEGSAERLSRLVARADAVLFLNAIHLVPDKAAVMREIRKVLRGGGVLGFNTTFFAGAYPEGTGGFWRRWIVRSVQWLREHGVEVQHNHADRTAAMQWLAPEDYARLCVEAGFEPPTVELVPIEMTAESLADIGRFSLFIEGALPGVPLEQGSEALQQGLARTLDELGIASVPRNWLECVAKAS
ncbi:MAG TPA: class I SAM-dependent methyltransferase [Gemmatimonadales bacterium]